MLRLSTIALLAAVAAAQCNGPHGNFNIPMPMPLQINVNAPGNPTLSGPHTWQFSLCQTAASSTCVGTTTSTYPAYVVEDNGLGYECDQGFDAASAPAYVESNGGLTMAYTGTYVTTGDRIAKVTLQCNPAATVLTPVGDVFAHASINIYPPTLTFDIVLETNAKGICPPSPPPTPSHPATTTPAPTTTTQPPVPPPPAPSGGVVVTEFGSLDCIGPAVANHTWPVGCSPQESYDDSTLRFCATDSDGSRVLRTQYFNASATCSGIPVQADSSVVGACISNPVMGTSIVVGQCI